MQFTTVLCYVTVFICFVTLLRVSYKDLIGSDKITVEEKAQTEIGLSNDCTEVWCDRYSFSEVEARYPGLFLTKFQFLVTQMISNLDRDLILYNEGVKDIEHIVGSKGDGDSCCVTKQVSHINYTLRNVYGQRRNVVHLIGTGKPRYQFITQAECIEDSECDGICVLEESVRTVLVFDGRSVFFDQVLIPSYCSCKRNRK